MGDNFISMYDNCIEEYYNKLISDESLIEMYKKMDKIQLEKLTDECIKDLKKYYEINDGEINNFDLAKIDKINDNIFNLESNIQIVEVSHKDIAIYFLLLYKIIAENETYGGGGDDNVYENLREKLEDFYSNNREIIGRAATLLIVLGFGLTL